MPPHLSWFEAAELRALLEGEAEKKQQAAETSPHQTPPSGVDAAPALLDAPAASWSEPATSTAPQPSSLWRPAPGHGSGGLGVEDSLFVEEPHDTHPGIGRVPTAPPALPTHGERTRKVAAQPPHETRSEARNEEELRKLNDILETLEPFSTTPGVPTALRMNNPPVAPVLPSRGTWFDQATTRVMPEAEQRARAEAEVRLSAPPALERRRSARAQLRELRPIARQDDAPALRLQSLYTRTQPAPAPSPAPQATPFPASPTPAPTLPPTPAQPAQATLPPLELDHLHPDAFRARGERFLAWAEHAHGMEHGVLATDDGLVVATRGDAPEAALATTIAPLTAQWRALSRRDHQGGVIWLPLQGEHALLLDARDAAVPLLALWTGPRAPTLDQIGRVLEELHALYCPPGDEG